MRREVIGSVAKVPFSLSILAAQPLLKDLRINNYAIESQSILGVQLDKTLGEAHPPGTKCGETIDFHCFIMKSLNRYAATLLALGAVEKQGDILVNSGNIDLDGDWYSIGNPPVKITKQPKSFIYSDGHAVSPAEVFQLPWAVRARELFDVDMRTTTPGALNESRHHLYMWRHAMRKDASQTPEALVAFSEVSPEKEHLDLNIASNFGMDYIPLILGQGASTWSGVKVAETFARIVNNQRVQASFVQVPSDDRGHYAAYPPLQEPADPAFEASRLALLAAMQDVVRKGTAQEYFKSILDSLQTAARARGMEVQVFAKTGTPRVASYVSSAESQEIENIVSEHKIQVTRGQPNGPMTIFYEGQKIERGDKSRLSMPKLRRRALEILAEVNAMDNAKDQNEICIGVGAKVSCPRNNVRAEKNDDGRNFAGVLNLLKDGRVHCSVSIAFSIVRTTDSDPLPNLVKRVFAEDGPIYRHLGLTKDGISNCAAQ